MKQVHGGNLRRLAALAGLAPEQILDFSASINPLGPPDWFSEVAAAALAQAVHYPDPECAELIEAIAARKGCREPETVAGNGSSELLFLLPRAVQGAPRGDPGARRTWTTRRRPRRRRCRC